ncbi:hypothetical protein [Bradyrhizobium sp. SZCCHNRI1058]|uniref:hypothetical protein n=1 Tax=Bradyrhizobium sp. SZCCHNRI1058 TaxID=3057279 RepID=UPI002916C2CF|nr:hypothetical protein [Bradyrhizobium sp. SZCCHNRI1058]
MALPRASETERTVHLRKIVESAENVVEWPRLTDEDLLLFARIIHMYSSIDFLLRMTVEVMDQNGLVASEWRGRTAKISNMYELNRAICSGQFWNEGHRSAFAAIEEHRRARNLVAHFIARRFPNENAFIFMTKSASDFKQVYGVHPSDGTMLYGVTDAEQLAGLIPVLKGILSWLSRLPKDLSTPVVLGAGDTSQKT